MSIDRKLIKSVNQSTEKLIKSSNKTAVILELFPGSDSEIFIKDFIKKLNVAHPRNLSIIVQCNQADFEKTMIIDPEKNNENQEVFNIYIMGHCDPGSDIITSKYFNITGQKLSYYVLAAKLVEFIELNHIEKRVIINLIACGAAAEDKETETSFAGKLQDQLKYTHALDVPIVARTHVVKITQEGQKVTGFDEQPFDTDLEKLIFINKQPGSKVIFTSDDQYRSIKVDAYAYFPQHEKEALQQKWSGEIKLLAEWKDSVIALLTQAKDGTKSEVKKAWLEDHITTFSKVADANIDTIYHTLVETLNNPQSPLHSPSTMMASIFNKSDTLEILHRLVETYPKQNEIFSNLEKKI